MTLAYGDTSTKTRSQITLRSIDPKLTHISGEVYPRLFVRVRHYADACFFLVKFTVSRFSTCSKVCELSRIFIYAACRGGERHDSAATGTKTAAASH